ARRPGRHQQAGPGRGGPGGAGRRVPQPGPGPGGVRRRWHRGALWRGAARAAAPAYRCEGGQGHAADQLAGAAVRESRADARRALVAALVLHALLFALMFAGMWWTRQAAPVSAAGPVIEADLVDPNALSAPMRAALDAPATPPP